MNATAAAAAAFAHAAAADAAAVAATAAAAPEGGGILPPPAPSPPYFYGPGTSGLPIYLAAMPPALGTVPPAPATMMLEQQQQQQQNYFLLQQQQLLQLQFQQLQQQQQHALQFYPQHPRHLQQATASFITPLPPPPPPPLQLPTQLPAFAAPVLPPAPPPAPAPAVPSLDALLFASAQAAAAGDSPLATRLADAAVALSPRSAAALAALWAALHSAPSPRLDLAIFYYGSALRLCPGDGSVLNNLGAALAAAGAPTQAAGAYRASLAALSSPASTSALDPSFSASPSPPSLSGSSAEDSATRGAIADVAANLGDLLRSSPEASASASAAGGGGVSPSSLPLPASSSPSAAAAAAMTTADLPPPPPLVASSWGSFGSGLSALVASTPSSGEATVAAGTGSPPPPPPPLSALLPPSLPSAAAAAAPSPSSSSALPPPHLIADARSAYLRALAAVPGHIRALTGLGDLCAESGDAAGAAEFYERAVAAAGGSSSGGPGKASAAASASASAISSPAPPPSPSLPSPSPSSSASASRARSGLAAALRDLGRLREAEAAAWASLSSDPCCPVALAVLTSALRSRGDAAGAAAAASPANSPEVFNALGNALREAGRPAEAVAAYSTCIRLQLSGVGGGRGGGGDVAAAAVPNFGAFPPSPSPFPPPYAAAEAAAARLAVAYSNMAAALRACDRPEEATRAYEQVALLRPSDPAAAAELGASLKDAGRHDEAAAAYRRALALLKARGLPGGAALAHLVHSLACIAEWGGDFPALLEELERETRADLASEPKRLPAVQPFHAMGYPFPPELARDLSMAYADHVEKTALTFVEGAKEKEEKEKGQEEQGEEKGAAAAAAKSSTLAPPTPPQTFPFRHPPAVPLSSTSSRLRVAFVSSDFGNHPLSHLMAGVWHRLKRGGKVEAFLFALSPSDGSTWRRRAEAEAEHFIAKQEFWADPSPLPLAAAIAGAGCHVAINLNGYTRGARGEAFALRPAPVQASYLGFPGTLGARRYIPWLISDAITSPPPGDGEEGEEEEACCYAESLARMPHCYFVNDYRAAYGSGSGSSGSAGSAGRAGSVGSEKSGEGERKKEGVSTATAAAAAAALSISSAPATPPRALPPPSPPPALPTPTPTPTRESMGLPPRPAVVFACANQLYKLDPATLRAWCRVLNAVPGSYLWLLRFPPAGVARVRAAAAEAGLLGLQGQRGGGAAAAAAAAEERIVFTDVAPRDLHVARCSLADVFLDTPLVNAHTTACDVLWSGVPIVTLPLRRMASRVCASLVTAAGLGGELVARDEEDYVRIAVRLGLDSGGERARLRRFLLSTRETTSALFDVDRWVRDFERLLLRLWEKHVAGEEPRSFELEKEEEEEEKKRNKSVEAATAKK